MDTFIMKLRGVSSNQNLPVFENVMIKNWIKTTENDQTINLSSRVGNLKLNNYEVSFDFFIPSDSPYINNAKTLAATRAGQSVVYLTGQRLSVNCQTAEVFAQENISLDVSHSFSLNLSTNKVILDGNEYTFEHTHSTSDILTYTIFSNVKPGSVYLGEVKFKKGNGDTYVLDLVPAVVNGTSCYKNILKDNDNLSTDNGDLVAFNL